MNFFEKAEEAENQKDWEKAVSIYWDYIRKYPVDSDAWVKLGNCLKEEQKIQDAHLCYEMSLIISPGNAELYLQFANFHRHQENWVEAISFYERSAEMGNDRARNEISDIRARLASIRDARNRRIYQHMLEKKQNENNPPSQEAIFCSDGLKKGTIGICVVVYNNFPKDLINSISDTENDIRWYIFFHGVDESIKKRLSSFEKQRQNVTYLPFGKNRGLSKSWNDALQFSNENNDEFMLIVNDDLFFRKGGFDEFIEFVRRQNDNFGLATVMGQESERSPTGTVAIPQEFACGVLSRKALQLVGFFDQNFSPAYWEDTDYLYRLHLAGLPTVVDDRILVEHDRSKTIRTSPELAKIVAEAFDRNQEYFHRKWGGFTDPNKHPPVRFTCPFNNEFYSYFISYETADDPYPEDSIRVRRHSLLEEYSNKNISELREIELQTNKEQS